MTDQTRKPAAPMVRVVTRSDALRPEAGGRCTRELWREEIGRAAGAGRWGPAIAAMGALHLAASAGLQVAYWSGDRTPWHYVGTWIGEVAAAAGVLRAFGGANWLRLPPMGGVVVRVWVTYLILAFNLASLNHLSGDPFDWYRPAWTTLGSFGFATMAWLVDLRFLLAAVQMYFTGLIILQFPGSGFLIHGASWWLALTVIGVAIEAGLRRRRFGVAG